MLTKTEVSDSYPGGLTTSYTYDGQGRVLTETDPPVTDRVTGAIHTAQTLTVYDPDGNVTAQTVSDLTGGDSPRTVSTTYNPFGQVASSTDANNVTTSYGYDAYGNRIKEVDGNNNEVDTRMTPTGTCSPRRWPATPATRPTRRRLRAWSSLRGPTIRRAGSPR